MSQLQQMRKGSTHLLILTVLADKPMYGYQIMRELEARSQGYFTMTAALLYPILHKLEADGLVTADWRDGSGKRQRKYYVITDTGRKALKTYLSEWRIFVGKLFSTLQVPQGGDA